MPELDGRELTQLCRVHATPLRFAQALRKSRQEGQPISSRPFACDLRKR